MWSVFAQMARTLGKAEKARNANRSPCKTGLGTAGPAHAQGAALEDCLRAVAWARLGSSSACSEQLADVPEDGAPERWLPWVPLAAPGRGLPRMFSRGRFVRPGHLDGVSATGSPRPGARHRDREHFWTHCRWFGSGAPSSLPVAEGRSSEVLLLSRLVIHSVHRRDGADDGLQESRGRSAAASGAVLPEALEGRVWGPAQRPSGLHRCGSGRCLCAGTPPCGMKDAPSETRHESSRH